MRALRTGGRRRNRQVEERAAPPLHLAPRIQLIHIAFTYTARDAPKRGWLSGKKNANCGSFPCQAAPHLGLLPALTPIHRPNHTTHFTKPSRFSSSCSVPDIPTLALP